MKTLYITLPALLIGVCSTVSVLAQQPTTVVPSSNCNFTYSFNATDEGFSAPSIYSDANDFGLFYTGSNLSEQPANAVVPRTASTISGVYFNTESAKTTVGFDYNAPAGTEYRIRIISAATNPPLEVLASTATGSIWTALPSTSGSICRELQDADLVINAQIRYEISFRAALAGPISIDNFRRLTFNAPLPVTFLGFIARNTTNNNINLLWNVGDEVNVRGYEVQMSADGFNFQTIAYVNASGADNYSYLFTERYKGNIYFRIRNVDADTRFKYSGIIRLRSNESLSDLNMYPMPARDQVYVEHPVSTKRASMSIFSIDGRVMLQVNAQQGAQQTLINTGNLKPGMYILKYLNEESGMQSMRFIKQ